MKTSSTLAVALGLVVTACAPSKTPAPRDGVPRDGLRARAAFEMWCPPNWLTLHELEGRMMLVQGCGARAVYLPACDTPGCPWRADTARITRPPRHHLPPGHGPPGAEILHRRRDPMETRD